MADALTTIDSATLERVFRAVRKVEAAEKSGFVSSGLPATNSSCPFINGEREDMPLGGVGRIVRLPVADAHYVVVKPRYAGITMLMIASGIVPAGGEGRGFTIGHPPAVVRLADWENVEPGDRVGAGSNTWDAVKHEFGPLTVLGKLDSPYAIVQLTGIRGESLITCDFKNRWVATAYFWWLEAPLYATQGSGGNIILRDDWTPS